MTATARRRDDFELDTRDAAPPLRLGVLAERAPTHTLLQAAVAAAPELVLTRVRHDEAAKLDLEAVDVVVVELRVLEAFEDLATVRKLRERRPLLPIVGVSENRDTEYVLGAFKAGVSDVVDPSDNGGVLAARLRSLDMLGRTGRLLELQNHELVTSMRELRDANVALRHEIAERQRAEEEREHARELVLQTAKMASLGEVAGSIAHEVKTPLAVVAGSLSMLRDLLGNGTGQISQALEIIDDAGRMTDRLAIIVRGLRSLASGGSEEEFETVSLRALLAETVTLGEDSVASADIALRVDLPGDATQIDCHPTQISQVLLNLLTNAKHAVAPLGERWIDLRTFDRGDAVEIRLTDSGPGIQPAVRAKLFQPFFTTKPRGIGTGLGLSISAKIAAVHGGSLFVDDGCANTRFVLVLPKKHLPVGK